MLRSQLNLACLVSFNAVTREPSESPPPPFPHTHTSLFQDFLKSTAMRPINNGDKREYMGDRKIKRDLGGGGKGIR